MASSIGYRIIVLHPLEIVIIIIFKIQIIGHMIKTNQNNEMLELEIVLIYQILCMKKRRHPLPPE